MNILITKLMDAGVIYFNGVVNQGDEFIAESFPDDFSANVIIYISVPGTGELKQEVRANSSCALELGLKLNWGALQVRGWTNEDQGTIDVDVPCVLTTTVGLQASAPADFMGPTDIAILQDNGATLETLGACDLVPKGT